MPRVGEEEVLGYLQKSGIVKQLVPPSSITGLDEGKIPTAPNQVIPVRSVMLNPSTRHVGVQGRKRVEPNRHINYRVLRRISEKAWLINTIITQQNKIRPFLKLSTDENIRGFQLRAKEKDAILNEQQKKRLSDIGMFIQKTGWGPDLEREDDIVRFGMKFVRDYLSIDQIATELQRTVAGQVYAYWAIDPATIIRCNDISDGPLEDAIRYVQEIDMVPTAYFTAKDLVFDYGNPRTDIDHSGYGYALTEQAIDLIIAQINAFWYNAGAMTEDNLPRGMLLLNGDADIEAVQEIEEYIIDIMSGGPQAKWRIPIIPAGNVSGGENSKKALEWVNFRNTNREQEYVEWTDHLWSAVAALFGVDLEELGIRTHKSGPVLSDNVTPRIEESKSRGLSSILSVLENHLQKIIDATGDDWIDIEFVGYERDDPKAKMDQIEAEIRTYRCIDDIRRDHGEEPYNQEWSKIPLNPQVVQMVMAQQSQGAPGAIPGMDGELPEEGRQEYEQDQEDEQDEQGWGDPSAEYSGESQITKSLTGEVIEIVV